MLTATRKKLLSTLLLCIPFIQPAQGAELSASIQKDYTEHLAALFEYFHTHPELSFLESNTAARIAAELRSAGFTVTEGVGGTGLVAILENGPGPMVMMRADMDGLPLMEASGLPYASTVTQVNLDGTEVPVMHACGHDVHITSLVGTARAMAASREQWSGTLMLIGQPAEEIVGGARAMMADDLWSRFGVPDYALAFHVASDLPTGKLNAVVGAPFSGVDSVDITVHGIGAHGAAPHTGVDPIVLGAQIVMGLQTLISRELAPRDAGVITVGTFRAGSKRNIISDQALLQLTVRNDNLKTREMLLAGIKRVAENMGRAAGLPEDLLPDVVVTDEWSPPTVNDANLTQRLRAVWGANFGADIFVEKERLDMGAEDFSFFTTEPYIPSTYFIVGGTPQAALDEAEAAGTSVPSHHSPLFHIAQEPAVTLGVEATVTALYELLQK